MSDLEPRPATFGPGHFSLEVPLGKGSYGTVYKACVIQPDASLPPPGSYVAIKVVNIDRNDSAGMESIHREINMLEVRALFCREKREKHSMCRYCDRRVFFHAQILYVYKYFRWLMTQGGPVQLRTQLVVSPCNPGLQP